jgi:RNA polymerase sigma-70 factor (ECF subfamily)
MLEGEPSAGRSEREVAFAAVVEQHLLQQYRLATVILGDPIEAQDATHDAFELAWRRWASLRDPDRLDAWFGRILVNVCRDRLRRRRRMVSDISAELVDSLAAPDDYRRTADRDEIGRAFAALNPDQQLVVVLRFYADLSIDQIAERVAAPAGTVKSRLHHALQALNGALVTGREGARA